MVSGFGIRHALCVVMYLVSLLGDFIFAGLEELQMSEVVVEDQLKESVAGHKTVPTIEV